MNDIKLFTVAPAMPEPLAFLETLAHNLWWCWNSDAVELFRRINPERWREVEHNPLDFLGSVPQARREALATNEGFINHLASVKSRYGDMIGKAGYHRGQGRPCVAYFSLEYGIHESVRMYSGGLGALAGDHLKAASDLGLPLVAVGLMYRQGYFQQYLNKDGWQQEFYPDNQIHLMPLTQAQNPAGEPVQVTVPLPGGNVHAVVWTLQVGRVPLYLLDTNLQENPPELRGITGRLYGGDRQLRLRQELLLGIGGFQALVALGIEPSACHMNEGHAAFLSLARIPHLVKKYGLTREAAVEVVSRTGVFTTHTPVPAGNECFDFALLRPHLDALQPMTGIPAEEIYPWGQAADGRNSHEVSMTILGLRMAHSSNGVSELHGGVAREMWQHLWPHHPKDEVPIGHVTNGVHVPSWISPDTAALFNRYLGDDWRMHPSDRRCLGTINQIPDEELWRIHELNRARLVRRARELLDRQMRARNSPRSELTLAKSVLDHDVLTIGFARRFATYKRATLLLRDIDRLEALLTNDERPVQLVFAGKAHPADDAGKEFIRRIVEVAHRPHLRRRIVFLENYDIGIARYLVQGCDLWLNTPQRPLEASGTSGMKAAVNGVLNCSVLDGWWCEGYSAECGWAIGAGEQHNDTEYQDMVESQALFNILENEVVPMFYDRESGDLPTRWLAMMKSSVKMGLGFFTSHRMLEEYDIKFYSPACETYTRLLAEGAAEANRLVAQRKRLAELWPSVTCSIPETDHDISALHVGDRFGVTTAVNLGGLKPEEVDVEVYYGPVNSENNITESHVEKMDLAEDRSHGRYLFRRQLECQRTGRYGFTARVIPRGPDWRCVMPGFMRWADGP